MIGKRALAWLGIVLLGSALLAVFIRVLELRIMKGDIYPHYATFRTDPLGSSGLYESFERMPGYSVEQNMEHLMRIRNLDGDTSLFLLGVPRRQYGRIRVPDESPILQAVREKGTRLIITLDPQLVPATHTNTLAEDEEKWLERRRKLREERRKKLERASRKREKSKEKADQEPKEAPQTEEEKKQEEDDIETRIELDLLEQLGPRFQDRFGIRLAQVKKFERPEAGWDTEPGTSIDPGGMTKAIPVWKSQERWEIDSEHEDEWKISATVDGEPVVAERKFGRGSIVLTTDSYFASNESLYHGGNSEFLLWLAGPKKRLVFDETMHGSVEKGGVVQTLRAYRLHGLLFGVIIFVILWAWKSASSLAPGDEGIDRGLVDSGGAVSGEDSKAGFIKLLQKSIPGKELINNCLATWRHSQVADLPDEKEQQINRIIHRHRTNPREHGAVATYRAIAELLRKRF